MPSPVPITLIGNNLGERHRYLNKLVAENEKANFTDIADLPENSTIDKLFKIDLASKIRNVDYILRTLKDEDMLYVSRALKSKWLLESKYKEVVNPDNLETSLYPEMITTAVNKMKHWIHLNLKNEKRCETFYSYYFDKDRKFALKYLPKCSVEFIIDEFPKVVNDTTPHLLKILCEKTPIVAKLFYDKVDEDKKIALKYVNNNNKYFDSIKCVLKTDSEIFLDIVEKYFRSETYNRLGKTLTKFILSSKKDRFLKKSEFYTSWVLHIQTVADCLSEEECEKFVIQFARCEFLKEWFEFKTVEPLIKRLDANKRSELKNKVFIRNEVGEDIKDWPYPVPKDIRSNLDNETSIWVNESDNDLMECAEECAMPERFQCGYGISFKMADHCGFMRRKTFLDKLFDEYRFKNFDKTLFDLRNKITSESSSQNRMYMILVLISKSGGKAEHLQALFDLLLKHCNEPSQVRAAIIRSLVKRAFVWRVTDDLWSQLLTFGHGLGLDGTPSDADCDEGLHAVVIRDLLGTETCKATIKTKYLKNFSTLHDYGLGSAEKQCIKVALQKMLLTCATDESDPKTAAVAMDYLIDTLEAYKAVTDSQTLLIPALKNLVATDKEVAQDILYRLFVSKIGRKELLRENFDLYQTDESYVNALKHDTTVLSEEKFLKALKLDRLNRFLSKVSIYFEEDKGLTYKFLSAIRKNKPEKKFARPLARLIGRSITSYILEIDGDSDAEVKRYAADIRANAHLARPQMELNSLEWKTAGVKLLANRVLVCKTVDINQNIDKLLKWKRSAKLALYLAQKVNKEHEVFPVVAEARPLAALKFGLFYFKQKGYKSDSRVWDAFKPLIKNIEQSIISSPHLQSKIREVNVIPSDFKPEYVALVFPILDKIGLRQSLFVLRDVLSLLSKMNEDFINSILIRFCEEKFSSGEKGYDFEFDILVNLYIKIIGKHLLLCKDVDNQEKRFNSVGQVFLNKMELCFQINKKKSFQYFETFLESLIDVEVYKNTEYVSCLSVMEKLVKWMKNVLPMEKHFNYYVKVHLSMLHFKSMRQSVKNYPEIFADKKKRNTEGTDIFGEILGRYIAREADELATKYFSSIVQLYGDNLQIYLHSLFSGRRSKISISLMKGILEESKGIERGLVVGLLNDNHLDLSDEERTKVWNLVKDSDKEMQFFYNNSILLSYI